MEEVSYGNRLVCTSLAFGPSDLCNQVLPSSWLNHENIFVFRALHVE